MLERKQKKKGRSVQDMIGIKRFTRYGLMTERGELLFYLVSPTNISVLSRVSIEIKIRHLMMVLSAIPDIEITCTDSSECFDDNKAYLQGRLEAEQNSKVRKLIQKDIDFLDNVQVEMATARQFLFTARLKGSKDKQVFDTANRIEKIISEQGFEVRRMKKADIKRFLAIYFEASMNGEQMPDGDGEQYYEVSEDEADLAVAQDGSVVTAHLAHAHAIQVIFALGRGVETAQLVEQGGFAGTRLTHNGDELALVDLEAYAFQGVDGFITHKKVAAHVIELYHHLLVLVVI